MKLILYIPGAILFRICQTKSFLNGMMLQSEELMPGVHSVYKMGEEKEKKNVTKEI